MERSELKELLKRKGVKPELIEMPAVVEPIYKDVVDKTVSQVEKSDDLKVNPDGVFVFNKRAVTPSETGGAVIAYGDATIDVNEYGIAISYSDGSWMDYFSHTSRKPDGTIEHSSGNNGNATMSTRTSFDNGSWSILNAAGAEYSNMPYIGSKDVRTAVIDKEAILKEFDENSQAVMKNYPGTISWYTERREALAQTLERETDPKLMAERRDKEQTEEIARLTTKNRELLESNAKLTQMLEKSLEFMSAVRNSPVGNLFFGKKIKEYEQGLNRLDKGRDDD